MYKFLKREIAMPFHWQRYSLIMNNDMRMKSLLSANIRINNISILRHCSCAIKGKSNHLCQCINCRYVYNHVKHMNVLSSVNYDNYKFESKRFIFTDKVLYEMKDSSKVETTVKALREEQKKQQQLSDVPSADTSVLGPETTPKPIDSQSTVTAPKRSLAKRVWDECVHYYHGFRLLIIDIRITSRLIWKILNGGDLTRREHRQLVRTASDVFRLVPFSVFIIVPFMEFLLPVFIKFFPNMLPSTFQTSSDKESKLKKELKLKLEMAKFLQNTLDEMSLKATGETHSHNAKEFAQFFDKIRTSGQQTTNEEILKFSKLFEDEITLDSLSRPQLVALCRLLELQPIGTNNFLRFQLRMQLRSLKADDQVIQKEGIKSLTVSELQQACRARGMRALGVSEDRLRLQLSQWLELSLNEHIPPSLLLLSRVLYLPENIPAKDQLMATIQALPKEVATEARYKIGETEGKIDNRTKIELIKIEEAAIKREKEEEEALAKEKMAKDAEKVIDKADLVIDKAIDIEKVADAKDVKDEQLSKEDIESIEDALENIAKEKHKLLIEKEELQEIKEEMADYKEDIEELTAITVKTGNKTITESKAAKRLRNRVDKMVEKMDNLVNNLDTKKQTLQQKIDIMAQEGKEIQSERDDVIGINDLLLAVRRLQKIGDDTKLQRIVEVLDMMDIDHDGQIEIEHVVKVLELLGRENVKLNQSQMKDIINLLIQEEKLEEMEKKRKQEKTPENTPPEKTDTKTDIKNK